MRGQHSGGRAPYGYADKAGTPREDEQRIVREICAWHEAGVSFPEICRRLNLRPDAAKRPWAGRVCAWHPDAVRDVVEREGRLRPYEPNRPGRPRKATRQAPNVPQEPLPGV